MAKGMAQAVVINSGNANACTGKQGMKDALAMTRLANGDKLTDDDSITITV